MKADFYADPLGRKFLVIHITPETTHLDVANFMGRSRDYKAGKYQPPFIPEGSHIIHVFHNSGASKFVDLLLDGGSKSIEQNTFMILDDDSFNRNFTKVDIKKEYTMTKKLDLLGKKQSFSLKPQKFDVIQFDGTNGREIVAWIKENGCDARNGGSYIHFYGPVPEAASEGDIIPRITVRKRDFLVKHVADDNVFYVAENDFHRDFAITKNHQVM